MKHFARSWLLVAFAALAFGQAISNPGTPTSTPNQVNVTTSYLQLNKLHYAGNWNSTVIYGPQDLVFYNSGAWISLQLANINHTPAAGAYWVQVPQAGGGSGCTLGSVANGQVVYNANGTCVGINSDTPGQALISQGPGTPPVFTDPVVSQSDHTLLNGTMWQGGTWTFLPGNTANTTPWLFTINQGGNSATVSAGGALKVDNTGNTQPISAASLPLPTGAATAAKQPALGTAGTPSTDVISIQGEASMTPLKVDGTATVQPVSATSLPLPTGAATAAKQPALGTAGSPSTDVITVQGNSSGTPIPTTPENVSTSGAALPSKAGLIGMRAVGTANLQSPMAFDVDSDVTTQYVIGVNLRQSGVGGSVEVGGPGNPLSAQGAVSDNGAAATSNRIPNTPGVYQTSYRNGTAATQGRDAALNVGTDGLLWTAQLPAIRPASYTASKKFTADSTTDNSCLPGNASNTVLVTELRISGVQTTAGIVNAEIAKRSAADTSGSPTSMTVVPDDSNYAAGVSAPKVFNSTGPTVGTLVGDIDNAEIAFLAAGTAGANDIYIGNWRQKPIVLRGTAENLCVNMGGAISGGTMTVTWKWIETATITP